MDLNARRDATSVNLIKAWLIDWLAQELGFDREKIDPRESFLSYGMDSVQAMTMVGDLEANLEVRLPPTLAWDYPDIDALSAHLASRFTTLNSSAHQTSHQETLSATSPATAEIDGMVADLDRLNDRDGDDLLQPYADSAR
jgi:acyl carrier protein